MGKFSFIPTDIEGVFVIEPTVYGDERGYFFEAYNHKSFCEGGIDTVFVQDNESSSKKGVLRGLHFQKTKPQAKLVRVTAGEVYDVCVDIRENSPTYGKHFGVVLSSENKKMFYIPKGLAHGFLVLSDTAQFSYKCSDFYDPTDEGGYRYDSAGIEWPKTDSDYILSKKDMLWEPLIKKTQS